MLGTSILSYKNTLSRNALRIFIHLVLHLAANCTAFCTKMRRFLLQTAHFHVIVAILCNIKGFASA